MAFGYDGRGLPMIDNHGTALRVWCEIKPWRGQTGDHDERPLEDRRKRHVTIKILRDGSVACRLHSTDVVTFTPDGRLKVQPYASQSTDKFFNRLLRHSRFAASFTSSAISAIQQDGSTRIYRTSGAGRLVFDTATGALLSETLPWQSRTVNTSAAARVRKASQYAAFVTWLKMMDAGKLFSPNQPYRIPLTRTELVASLNSDDRMRWFSMVVFRHGGRGEADVAGTCERVRKALYKMHKDEVYNEITDTYFTSWSEVDTWRQRRNRE